MGALLVLDPDALTNATWADGDVRELPEATGWGWDQEAIDRAYDVLSGLGYARDELRLHAVPDKPWILFVATEEPEDEEYAVAIAPVLDPEGPYAAKDPADLKTRVGKGIFRARDPLHILGLFDAVHLPKLAGIPDEPPADLHEPPKEEF